MDNCTDCGEPLKDSLITEDGKFKSCPECSRTKGRHAFYRTPLDFGLRNNGGKVIVQSWCRRCRPEGSMALPDAAFYCGE